LLIKNCWFEKVWHRNIQDATGKKVQYIKTEFHLWDESVKMGFPGTWWGHYKDEIPPGRCDAIVEIDFNSYERRYEVRLIAVRSCVENYALFNAGVSEELQIVDCRLQIEEREQLQMVDGRWQIENKIKSEILNLKSKITLIVRDCPSSWDELQGWVRRAYLSQQKLAIAYPPPQSIPPTEICEQLLGIAKYLSRTGKTATLEQIQQKLGIGNATLLVGLRTLSKLGFEIANANGGICIEGYSEVEDGGEDAIPQFLAAIREEQFRRQFFSEVPVETIQSAFQSLI
jgi:single-stranded-DNA-specific exonuclease